jgi:hypothetical protein
MGIMPRLTNWGLSRLTYYELVLYFRTEFRLKSTAAVDLDKPHRDFLDCICTLGNRNHGTVRATSLPRLTQH